MRKRNIICFLTAATGMVIIILDGKSAVSGVRHGIEMCLQTLIPSLFPFFFLSGIITSSLLGQTIRPFNAVGKICHMPEGCEFLLAIGILGGYPVGADMVWKAHRHGTITEEDANRLVIFCNNPGPSFLFGVLGPMFPNVGYVFCIWVIQIVSAIITGAMLQGKRSHAEIKIEDHISLTAVLNRAVRTMASVCGWVIVFRLLLEYLDRWIRYLPFPEAQVLLTGILELSNGCLRLQEITDIPTRFLLACIIMSCGGICVLMQTKSVFPKLNTTSYLLGKSMQLLFCFLLSLTVVCYFRGWILQSVLFFAATLFPPMIQYRKYKRRKLAVAIT